jgi:hypothetical protein
MEGLKSARSEELFKILEAMMSLNIFPRNVRYALNSAAVVLSHD